MIELSWSHKKKLFFKEIKSKNENEKLKEIYNKVGIYSLFILIFINKKNQKCFI